MENIASSYQRDSIIDRFGSTFEVYLCSKGTLDTRKMLLLVHSHHLVVDGNILTSSLTPVCIYDIGTYTLISLPDCTKYNIVYLGLFVFCAFLPCM